MSRLSIWWHYRRPSLSWHLWTKRGRLIPRWARPHFRAEGWHDDLQNVAYSHTPLGAWQEARAMRKLDFEDVQWGWHR